MRTVFLLLVAGILMLSSCWMGNNIGGKLNTEFNYFQSGLDSSVSVKLKPLKIKPNDLISIQVYSSTLNQEQVAVYNLANNGGMAPGAINQQLSQSVSGYLVDNDGNVMIPSLGVVKAAGMTRVEFAEEIQKQLSAKELVKSPNVLVRFINFKVNVLGEVKAPGMQTFNSDRVTILDALSSAGDLTDRGRRDSIVVLREVDGMQKRYNLTLLDGSFLHSEGYQMQQNDVVYVYANKIKLKETRFDPKVTRDLQIGLSVASFASFLLNLIILVTK
ncbi:MAG: polysaccharide biosynthesis/export family protein [Chitinophagaceae bacterium]